MTSEENPDEQQSSREAGAKSKAAAHAKQRTARGFEIPIPKRADFDRLLGRVTKKHLGPPSQSGPRKR